MTCPRLDRDLLMFLVSFNYSPKDPELARLSEPTKSIRFKEPGHTEHQITGLLQEGKSKS